MKFWRSERSEVVGIVGKSYHGNGNIFLKEGRCFTRAASGVAVRTAFPKMVGYRGRRGPGWREAVHEGTRGAEKDPYAKEGGPSEAPNSGERAKRSPVLIPPRLRALLSFHRGFERDKIFPRKTSPEKCSHRWLSSD